jgi:hypothetical protein
MTTPTHDTRLAILWDIDGPLNPYAAKSHQRPAGYATHRLRPHGYEDRVLNGRRVKPLRVWLNPDHGAKMLALAHDLDAANWWATSWCDDANTLIAPLLGLPEFPVLHTKAANAGWKWTDVARRFVGQPVIWFDDFDHGPDQPGPDGFLCSRGDVPTLLCRVDPRMGLCDGDLDAARAWAASLPGGGE